MKIGLSAKLISGFVGVGLITLVVGTVGYMGLSQSSRSIDVLVNESIPTIIQLETVFVRQQAIKASLRTLTSPYITDEEYGKQLDALETLRKERDGALALYDAVPRTKERTHCIARI